MIGDLFNDAAPRGSEASVTNQNVQPDVTRLPLAPPAHRNAPPGTSSVAASRIRGYASKQRATVLEAIACAGAYGATDAEIQERTGIISQSVTPRRGELVKLGLIEDSGRRRNTPRGRPAAVWVPVLLVQVQQGGAA